MRLGTLSEYALEVPLTKIEYSEQVLVFILFFQQSVLIHGQSNLAGFCHSGSFSRSSEVPVHEHVCAWSETGGTFAGLAEIPHRGGYLALTDVIN